MNFDIKIPAKLANAANNIIIPITKPFKCLGASNVACSCQEFRS
ncbi:hypothetical protein [Candidatus Tisiphia endosymbiont of Parasteatoda lunata]